MEGYYATLSKSHLTKFIAALTLHAFCDSRLTTASKFECTVTVSSDPICCDGYIHILRTDDPTFHSEASFGWIEKIAYQTDAYDTRNNLRATYETYARPKNRLVSIDAAVDFPET